MTGWERLEFHELADLFPLLSEEEQSSLADEIERVGYLPDEPIVLLDGRILDGRNRYLACLALHREGRLTAPPPFIQWHENGASPLDWVIARNLHRRHLDATQRATVAEEALPLFEAEARKRQQQGGKVKEKIPEPSTGEARDKAAAAFGVNPRYIQDVKKIRRRDPALAARMKAGKVTLQRAKSILKKEQRPAPPPPAPLPKLVFDVLYADPPWRYDFSAVDDWAVENSYPTLSLPEICALAPRVQRLAGDNAVLFLWATSPKLPDALEVMRAWGFTYKTSAVWVKHRTGAGMGYYVRVDHEFLLIGTRGKVNPPHTDRRLSSVIEATKGKHSEKPEEARQMIEFMYPDAQRIELFARAERPGWSAWGNEA